MPEPLLQLILGSLGGTITVLAGYIVKQWASQIADLKADVRFWRDRSLNRDEREDKAMDTLAQALSMVHERTRGGDR